MRRRKERGEDFYRSGTSTLKARIRKKMLDPVRWYKPRVEDSEEGEKGKKKEEEGIRRVGKKRKGMDERNVKAVMFCPYTRNSELAKNLRQEEEKLMSMTGYRMKVVEQAGRKITELLHSSNP